MRRKRAVAVSVQLAESEDPQPALGVRNAFRLCRSADQSHIKRPCEIILLFKCYATLCCHWGDFCTYSSVKTLDTVVSFKLLFLFFLKCLYDPSEWQYERRPPCVAFSRDFWCDFVFRVQLFIPPQIIFTTTDKHGETTGFKTNREMSTIKCF